MASAVRVHADLMTHGQQRTAGAIWPLPDADVLAEWDQPLVDLHPIALRQHGFQRGLGTLSVGAATIPQRLVMRWTWMSTAISGRPSATPSASAAIFGPTPRKVIRPSTVSGVAPPNSFAMRCDKARRSRAFGSGKVTPCRRRTSAGSSRDAIASGVRAVAKRRRQMGMVVSSACGPRRGWRPTARRGCCSRDPAAQTSRPWAGRRRRCASGRTPRRSRSVPSVGSTRFCCECHGR